MRFVGSEGGSCFVSTVSDAYVCFHKRTLFIFLLFAWHTAIHLYPVVQYIHISSDQPAKEHLIYRKNEIILSNKERQRRRRRQWRWQGCCCRCRFCWWWQYKPPKKPLQNTNFSSSTRHHLGFFGLCLWVSVCLREWIRYYCCIICVFFCSSFSSIRVKFVSHQVIAFIRSSFGAS